jgi:hypothetical protein
VLARNAQVVRQGCPVPLLLENPADILGYGTSGRDAGVRLGRAYRTALFSAGAGALLDLTNLVLSARNDGYAAEDYLWSVPMERVAEVHLAGGHQRDGLWIDSHAHDVDAEALALLPEVARRALSLCAVIIERDDRLPALSALLEEVAAVRKVLRRCGR